MFACYTQQGGRGRILPPPLFLLLSTRKTELVSASDDSAGTAGGGKSFFVGGFDALLAFCRRQAEVSSDILEWKGREGGSRAGKNGGGGNYTVGRTCIQLGYGKRERREGTTLSCLAAMHLPPPPLQESSFLPKKKPISPFKSRLPLLSLHAISGHTALGTFPPFSF